MVVRCFGLKILGDLCLARIHHQQHLCSRSREALPAQSQASNRCALQTSSDNPHSNPAGPFVETPPHDNQSYWRCTIMCAVMYVRTNDILLLCRNAWKVTQSIRCQRGVAGANMFFLNLQRVEYIPQPSRIGCQCEKPLWTTRHCRGAATE